MTLTPFEPIAPGRHDAAADIDSLQNRLEIFTDRLVDQPGLDTALIEDQALLAASTVLVEHTLGRAYRGWRVVDKNANATVWRDTTSTADATLFLPLACSANVTVDLEVF